jgi:kynureninase
MLCSANRQGRPIVATSKQCWCYIGPMLLSMLVRNVGAISKWLVVVDGSRLTIYRVLSTFLSVSNASFINISRSL